MLLARLMEQRRKRGRERRKRRRKGTERRKKERRNWSGREKIQIPNIRNERSKITTDTTDLQRIIRKYYKQFYTNKFVNLDEMFKFTARYKIIKTDQRTNRKLE